MIIRAQVADHHHTAAIFKYEINQGYGKYVIAYLNNFNGLLLAENVKTLQEANARFNYYVNTGTVSFRKCPKCHTGKLVPNGCYARTIGIDYKRAGCTNCDYLDGPIKMCAGCEQQDCKIKPFTEPNFATICEFLKVRDPRLCANCKGCTDKVQGCPNHR